jgi:hypothetical protein
MAKFVLTHSHEPAECRIAYAAWTGHDSPLRGRPAVSSCARGEHHIFWVVDAAEEQAALRQLPDWVAARTAVSEVTEVTIP